LLHYFVLIAVSYFQEIFFPVTNKNLTMDSELSELNCICAHGSLCIAAGRYEDAIDAFDEALVHARTAMVSFNSSAVDVKSVESIGFIHHPRYLASSTLHDQTTHQNHPGLSKSKQIFNKPLVIPNSGTFTNEQYQFVILYNLALAYHLCSVERQNGAILDAALRLWTLVYRFHWNDDLGLLPLHTCAILNNLGHVYHLLGDAKASRECHESLLCALLVLQRSEDSSFPECNADCFFRSITSLVLKDSKAACAA
jgi:tetratricopeptide (TPR) repeat protein